ncbi:MAG: GIY-YIG nuclease family protein, partial [Deltaproteobacteria bacterium]
YKEAKRSMGIYRIKIILKDKIYIGIDTDLPAKINRHKAELKFGSHRNKELQQAWNKFGEPAFDFEVLDVLDPKEAPKQTLPKSCRSSWKCGFENLKRKVLPSLPHKSV